MNQSYRLYKVIKRFKKLIIFGCSECIGQGFLYVFSEKVKCNKCNGYGTFKKDPAKIIDVNDINKQLINTINDDRTQC